MGGGALYVTLNTYITFNKLEIETKRGRVSRKEKSDTDSSSNNPDHSIEQARYLYSIKTRELDNDIKEYTETESQLKQEYEETIRTKATA